MQRISIWIVGVCLLNASPAFGQATADSAWHQWRGPSRDGRVEGDPWPMRLADENFKRLWRVELAPSYSGPVVNAGHVFTTATVDRTIEEVYALDRRSGKKIWTAKWKGSLTVPFFASRNGSWIRATPCVDGDRIFVAGMRDVLVCLDAKTGREIWNVNFVKQFGTSLPSFGFVSSPMVDGGHVYVQAGGSFVKLKKKTGAIVWRTLKDGGGMFGSAFSSPIFANVQGRRMIVVQTRTKLAGVDDKTGKVLWSQTIPAFRGMNILTPTVYGNSVFTSSYGGKSLLVRVNKNGGNLTASESWSNKAEAYMSSPIVYQDHIYLLLRNRLFACIDLKTGKTAWTGAQRFGQYMSMVAQGDRILALDQRGILYQIRANPQRLEIINERRVSDAETWAHLAVDGDQLLIRELNALAVFRWTKSQK